MKSDKLITFSNQDIGEIRGFIKDGEPWFLAGQVCRCLGIKNSRDAVKTVSDRYKIADIKGVGSSYTLLETEGGKQNVQIIPEPFLYELIFQSRKKKAIQFRAWITTEVLPSLRKNGEHRMQCKLITSNLHDAIKDKVIPAMESENGKKFAYSNFHRLINKSLGLEPKTDRDSLDAGMLEKIAQRENLANALANEGKDYNSIKDILLNL